MENLMEMEYVINGEKYLITVTKVEDATAEKKLKSVDTNTYYNCDKERNFFTNDEFEVSTIEKPNEDVLLQLSLTMCPTGMSVAEWLDIIKEYNVILTD